MASTDPRLRAALDAARRETGSAVADLHALASDIGREHESFRRSAERDREERARAAREGELGPEMQRVQERVDRRLTTWEEVLEGSDPHPSASAVRDRMAATLAEIAEQVRADPEVAEREREAREAAARVREVREVREG